MSAFLGRLVHVEEKLDIIFQCDNRSEISEAQVAEIGPLQLPHRNTIFCKNFKL